MKLEISIFTGFSKNIVYIRDGDWKLRHSRSALPSIGTPLNIGLLNEPKTNGGPDAEGAIKPSTCDDVLQGCWGQPIVTRCCELASSFQQPMHNKVV